MATAAHRDVEFFATRESSETAVKFETWGEARAYMIGFAGQIDVCVYSQAGAHAVSGDEGVDAYLEDEDASVFERYVRKNPDDLFECIGRVP